MHTLELAAALHRKGHGVCVYALDKDGTGWGRALDYDYQPVPAAAPPQDPDLLIQQRIQEFVDFLTDHLPERHYDIYHAQDCISANALGILRQRGLIPGLVRTVHHIEDYHSPYLQQCQDRSIREPDLCLCVSDYWQQQLLQQYQILALRVINGVDLDRFTPIPSDRDSQVTKMRASTTLISPQELSDQSDTSHQLKKQFGLTGNPIFLTVGGIEPRKNTLQILQGFAQVQSSLPQAQLVIAGGATLFDYQAYREEFFTLARTLGLEQALVLPGIIAHDQLPNLYRCADAFVFPSLKEGWGLVVLEAIACGLPVIVSRCPPFTEFLTDQQALFVDLTNSEDTKDANNIDHNKGLALASGSNIAQALAKIIQPEVAKSLIENSRIVVDTYSWSVSADLHLQHYQALLNL